MYGTEEFLKAELQRVFLENALQPHEKDFNLDIVYGADVDASQIVGLCSSYPVMAPRRVVIVRDLEKLKGADPLVAYAENPNEHATVMFVCRGRPNLNTNPYRALKRVATDVAVESPKEWEVAGWISSYMKERGHKMDPRAAQMLADYVGADLQSVVGELDKLQTYIGDRKEITLDDVIAGSGQTREINIFELQKAVGAANYVLAVTIAERMLSHAANQHGEAIRTVMILTSYFTKLRILTNCQAKGVPKAAWSKTIGVNSYFMQDYVGSLRYYGSPAIENAFSTLLAAEYELKGGSALDSRLIMNLMLRRIIPTR